MLQFSLEKFVSFGREKCLPKMKPAQCVQKCVLTLWVELVESLVLSQNTCLLLDDDEAVVTLVPQPKRLFLLMAAPSDLIVGRCCCCCCRCPGEACLEEAGLAGPPP